MTEVINNLRYLSHQLTARNHRILSENTISPWLGILPWLRRIAVSLVEFS